MAFWFLKISPCDSLASVATSILSSYGFTALQFTGQLHCKDCVIDFQLFLPRTMDVLTA